MGVAPSGLRHELRMHHPGRCPGLMAPTPSGSDDHLINDVRVTVTISRSLPSRRSLHGSGLRFLIHQVGQFCAVVGGVAEEELVVLLSLEEEMDVAFPGKA